MTLVSEIIRDAYRESNLVSIYSSPTTEEEDEGLRLLNRYIAGVYGTTAGEELRDIVIGRNNLDRPQGFPWYDQVPDQTDWYVPPNTRLVLNLTSPQTVYLDPVPQDGARFAILDKSGNLSTNVLTIDGNGRTIEDSVSVTVSTDAANREYFYRADTGNWALVTPLTTTDAFPFPLDFEDVFVIGLALRINPRHGAVMDQQSMLTYTSGLKDFKAKYRQSREVGSELGLIRTPNARHRYSYDSRRANALFDAGYPYFRGY